MRLRNRPRATLGRWCLIATLAAVPPGCASPSGSERAEATPASAELPDGFPMYPGATPSSVEQLDPSTISATLRTAGAPSEVASVYAYLLSTQGWKKTKLKETQGDWAVSARKGRQIVMLVVTEAERGSNIDVLLIRKGPRGRHQRTQRGTGQP